MRDALGSHAATAVAVERQRVDVATLRMEVDDMRTAVTALQKQVTDSFASVESLLRSMGATNGSMRRRHPRGRAARRRDRRRRSAVEGGTQVPGLDMGQVGAGQERRRPRRPASDTGADPGAAADANGATPGAQQ